MASAGITVHTTTVGDRAVLEALEASGWSLGGEQSGHLVFRDLATTGDGVLSGLLLCDLILRHKTPLGVMAAAAMERLPQVLRNVAVADRDALADTTGSRWAPVWEAVAAVETELGAGGRVLLRPSGTEPLVRVMVEAPTHESAETATDRVAGAVEAALGWPGPKDHCR
jgi:phosphoglucosamine mutase